MQSTWAAGQNESGLHFKTTGAPFWAVPTGTALLFSSGFLLPFFPPWSTSSWHCPVGQLGQGEGIEDTSIPGCSYREITPNPRVDLLQGLNTGRVAPTISRTVLHEFWPWFPLSICSYMLSIIQRFLRFYPLRGHLLSCKDFPEDLSHKNSP